MKKTKRRVKVNLVLSLVVCILVLIMLYCILNIFHNIQSKAQSSVEILDTIHGYDYELNENDSAYFKSLFEELKKVLEKDEVDEEMYASLIAKLFVTDFYSLDCALNKNDVGGVQFVYKDYRTDFISKAKTSVYNYVQNDIYGDRKQELPMVTNVEVDDISSQEYLFEDIAEDDNAYMVTLSISYAKDLSYPQTVTLVLIHDQNKLEIAKME